MKITQEILDAISRAAEQYGNVSELAKAMGVAHSTIIFWRRGQTASMSAKLWNTKVKDVLAPFMPSIRVAEPGGLYVHRNTTVERTVRVIPLSQLSSFDPAIESITEFIRAIPNGAVHVFSMPGCFCFPAEDIPNRDFPAGSYILALRRHPKNGDRILGKLQETGEIFLGRYLRTGNTIVVEVFRNTRTGTRTEKISWDCRSMHGVLLWGFPLAEVSMSLLPMTNDDPAPPSADESVGVETKSHKRGGKA